MLGEQSAKSLRGSKMNEVIFQAAEGKNSKNMAEVKLKFDNEDKTLDLPYDKVVISRRIYRDGENEYRINGQKVRLKDIRELFLDTGIGKEGYSIIGQGRIDEIISSSNQERRAIFEEASGISKHKYRRDEAFKKLSKVSDDLEIIEREWEYKSKDLKKLEIEAANYNKWLDLTENLNYKSYYYLKNKSEKLLANKDDLQSQLATIEKDYLDKTKQLSALKGDLEPFKKELDTFSLDLVEKEEKLSKALKLLESNRNKIELNKKELTYNQKDLDRLEANLSSNESRIKSLKTSYGEEKEKLKQKNDSISKVNIKIEEEKQRLNEIIEDNEEINKKIQRLDLEKSKISKLIYDYEINSKTNEILQAKSKEENIAKLQKLDTLLKEIKELEEEKENLLKEKNQLSKKEDELLALVKDENEKSLALEKDFNILQKNISQKKIELKTEINDYKINKKIMDSNQGYFYSVGNFLNKTKNTDFASLYEGTLANLITVKSGYEDIIDILLSSALQNIVTRSKDDTKILIKFVNQNKIGKITFLPIDSIFSKAKHRPNHKEVIAMANELLAYDKKYENIINHFLGSTVVVEDIEKATELSKKIKGYRIVTRDLDIINSWGSMVAGSKSNKKSNSALLNRKKHLEDTKLKITKLRTDCQILDKNEKELIEGIEKNKNTLKIYKDKSDNLREESDKIRELISNLSYKLDNLEEQKTGLESSNDDYQIKTTDIDIKELRNKEDKYNNLVNKQKEILDKNESLREDLKNSLNKNTNTLELLKRDINMVTNEIARIENELTNINQGKDIEDKLRNETTKLILKAKADNQNLEASNEDLKKNIKTLNIQINDKKQEISYKQEENALLITKNKELEEKVNDLKLNKVKLSYDLEAISKEYNNLIDEIKPFISHELTELEILYKDKTKLDVSKIDLINLQKEINKLGYFTDQSQEQFEKIKEEFDFIDSQVKDLKESKGNIEQMIRSLEDEMKTEFKEKFDLINERFAKIFQILFMGGNARLKLDSEDELLAGVDIIARPPSKSLKSISLLSGGEKALTAVALLFAIFETNPAPFAILDEIDAALDETNIKRYIEYLKGLSENSQFIMITHRQTTMQLAEQIHGVTIDEDGISKIYSIDFANN